jgi:Zn-dependent alcohol dehydrogenase
MTAAILAALPLASMIRKCCLRFEGRLRPLLETMLNVIARGYTYMGIIEGDSDPDEFIPQLIDLYRAGRFPFDRLIKTYPLTAINEAVTDQQRGACVKAVPLSGAG